VEDLSVPNCASLGSATLRRLYPGIRTFLNRISLLIRLLPNNLRFFVKGICSDLQSLARHAARLLCLIFKDICLLLQAIRLGGSPVLYGRTLLSSFAPQIVSLLLLGSALTGSGSQTDDGNN
jgi:hypothetical protein